MLTKLPNIGPKAAEQLNEIGITTPNDLYELGTEKVFTKLFYHFTEDRPCINMLMGIDGAISGIRWHNLSPERKEELRHFYKSLAKDFNLLGKPTT